ncbi:MAG: dihydropteroate synthase [Flavobacteriaceae bacterium]|nr:dihydropteroate synthase [Flavobacteriaceae bacterium]MDG1974743.1 dihydropteroate synthase [Flavobacteriaceae bacterium]|tara:strand:+ start:3152 stop:3982 length:831 start_codon:yes stop_codon:yes gene_type:complete
MTINIKGKLMDFSSPKIMGILNITPDSFYDGGMFDSNKKILKQVEKMLEDGADIIDIGGCSSKPGSKKVITDDEIKRVIPTIELIKSKFNEAIISVDTFRSEVAKKAVNSGASIVNDISAGELDPNMFNCVAELGIPYIMMHMQGSPQTMQNKPKYNNVVNDIITNLSKKIFRARELGIIDIVVDPGFGFGKTLEHNYQILNDLSFFKELDCPILVGISRKSMIYKILNNDPKNALNGTTCLNTVALSKGANILRVHDVKEAKEIIKLTNFLVSSS